MEELSDTINRKFIESYDIDDFEIMTDSGWVDAKAIHKTVKYDIWVLTTATHELKCADTHIVFDEHMNQVFVKDLVPGQMIYTDVGLECVESIVNTCQSDNMYDIELSNESDHRYYTNGILSHNTTCYTVFCMWLATLFPEKKIMICANKLQTAIEIMDRLRVAYEYLPAWIKPGVLVYNKQEITFSNQSSIRAFATSSSASRGFSGQICIIDEMAFIPKNIIEEFFASVMPVVSSAKNSKAIVVSTPNGTSGLYYDIWQAANSKDASKNKEGWKPFRIDWWEVPGRNEEWKEKQIATIGKVKFAQEFCNEFLAASSIKKLIPDDILERYRMKLSEYKTKEIKPKIQRIVSQNEDEVYEFKMWHEFDPSHTYLASADIAEGIGGDSSVLYIWDVTNLSNIAMCAKFSSNTVSLVQFAYIASKILALYNNPFLAAERNGVSAGMLDSLRITYGYQNIVVENKKNEPGIYSHVQVKSKACLWARDMLTTAGFGWTLYDKELIDEMSIFVKKDTKGMHNIYQALPGPNSHDDHIMTLIWACYCLQNDIIEKYFVVCQTFTSEFNQIYAKILQPIEPYTIAQIKLVQDDQMYKDFIEFKEELNNKLKIAFEQLNEQDKNDMFKYNNTQYADMYFDDDWGGGQWNSYQPQHSIQHVSTLNTRNVMPRFFMT